MKDNHKPLIPTYAYLPLVIAIAFNCLVYYAPKFLVDPESAYDLALGIDRAIPFLPIFILFYVLAYLQWILGYVVIARESRDAIYQAITINIIAKTICGILFVAVPTVMVHPEITEGGFFNQLTAFIYAADTPAINLFPSIHCLESWAVFRLALKLKLPIGYKIAMGVFSLGVFLSVLFVKQHIIIDIPAGILAFELGYLIVHLTKIDKKIANLCHKKTKSSC